MSGPYIANAAPMVIDLGTQDNSTVQAARTPISVPQHLPKFFLYTQKGPTTPQLVSGADRINMFGQASFNYPGPYANHATVFSNLVDGQGNMQMIQRLIPADAGPNANLTMWLDVLPTQVPVYTRNSDGSIATDANGNPIASGTTVAGFKVKWVVTNQTTVAGLQAGFGTATITPGDQVDTTVTPNVQSQRYPMFDFQTSSQGAWGNLAGIRMWAGSSQNNVNFPTTMMETLRTFPYYFSVVEAPNSMTSPSVIPTVLTDQSVMTVLKPQQVDPTTGAQLYVGDVFIQSYQDINNAGYSPIYGDFSQMAVYQANIDNLLGQFYAAELAQVSSFSDITTNPQDMYLINIANFKSSSGVPYTAIVPVSATNSVAPSQYTNIMAAGASDGTMSEILFNGLVQNAMAAYIDPNNSVMDIAVNVESILYDSGFNLQTKQSLCNFVGVRKDTFVVLGTYDVSQPVLTQAEEMSVAITLRTRLQMFPESDYFGTAVMRGMIMGYSGTLLNSTYTKPLPLTAEVAIKASRYMGAGNGSWKSGYNFDGAPGSILDYMVNPSIGWLPVTVRNKAWSAGLNWVQHFDRSSVFFPALKTVYDDDTSVLNSFFTAMAVAQLNKVAHAAWRQFSGVSHLTNIQLASKVNDFVNANTQGRFDNRFVIIPSAFFTDQDVANGFSWTLPIKIYASNMETVMTTYVQAYRMSDLTTTTGG